MIMKSEEPMTRPKPLKVPKSPNSASFILRLCLMFLDAELKSPDELLIANSTLTRTKKRTTRKPRERVILDLGFCNNFSFSFSIDVCYFYSLTFGFDLYIICPMKFK